MIDLFDIQHWITFIEKDYKYNIRINFNFDPIRFIGYIAVRCNKYREYYLSTAFCHTTEEMKGAINNAVSHLLSELGRMGAKL